MKQHFRVAANAGDSLGDLRSLPDVSRHRQFQPLAETMRRAQTPLRRLANIRLAVAHVVSVEISARRALL
jgi:hypothetical protein